MHSEYRDDFEDQESDPFIPDGASTPPGEGALPVDETRARKKLRIRLIITLFAMILAVEIGGSMLSAPTTRIYEAITCQKYYEKHDKSKIGKDGQTPEELCKNEEIQGEMAIVTGYRETFDALFGGYT
jgi:hypothetical protein